MSVTVCTRVAAATSLAACAPSGHQHHAVASAACALRLLGHQDHHGIGGHQLWPGIRSDGFGAGGKHVHDVTGADEIQQSAVGQGQRNDASVRACHRFGQPRSQYANVGEHLTAAGRAGQRGTYDRADLRLRTIGNRCRRSVFESHIIRRQFDTGSQVARRDDNRGAVTLWVGARCNDGGQNDEGARSDPAGGQRARPVRPQHGQ